LGVVRLLEQEPTKAERYAHAAELLAIIQRHAARAAQAAILGSVGSRRASPRGAQQGGPPEDGRERDSEPCYRDG
jgi:hypothetical protein